MAAYSISIGNAARRQLDKLPDHIASVLLTTIQALSINPRPAGCKKLKGVDAWRVRKGDYRIIYEVRDTTLLITVVAVGHRRDIYE